MISAKSMQQMEENMKAGELELAPEEIQKLNEPDLITASVAPLSTTSPAYITSILSAML